MKTTLRYALTLARTALLEHGAPYLYHELRYQEAISFCNDALAAPGQEPMVLAMQAVADTYAHRLALELECVLADRPHYYDSAMQVLGEYHSAMNAIHEKESPTFMGEPSIQGRAV